MRKGTIPCLATLGLTIQVTITQGNQHHQVCALDSGTTGSFIDYEMAMKLAIQPVILQKPLNIMAVKGSGEVSQCSPPLQVGQHQEWIQFFLIQ